MQKKEQKVVLNFFWHLHDSYKKLLRSFYKSGGVDIVGQPVTIKSISNMLIALEVFNLYYGKKSLIETKDKDENRKTKEIDFIPEGDIKNYNNAFWFLLDVLGSFLLLSVNGNKIYDYDLLINKQKEMCWNLFSKSLFAICNVSWNDRINGYRDTLLLNLLFYINLEDVHQEHFETKLHQSLTVSKDKAQKISENYGDNVEYFFKIVLPKYKKWATVYLDMKYKVDLIVPVADLRNGSIVYKKAFGFAQLIGVKKSNTSLTHLHLLAAGFEWKEEEEACLLPNHPNGNKIVHFK